jgi:hypothetical protein
VTADDIAAKWRRRIDEGELLRITVPVSELLVVLEALEDLGSELLERS